MIYDDRSHINTPRDVEIFFNHLLFDCKLNFHPDCDFADYIDIKTKKSSFEGKEVELYNRLMEESFCACEKANVDIYGIGVRQQELAFGFCN